MLGQDLGIDVALAGYPVGWWSPTYKDMANVWGELTLWLRGIIASQHSQLKQLRLVTGGGIDMWSMTDPNAGQGYKYARAIIDEAAKAAKLQHAWEHTIRPTLTDYQGDAWFLSSTKGRNYFYQLYRRACDPLQDDWRAWQFPTSTNPHIALEEIEDARQTLPAMVFAQEYEAAFADDAGTIFRNVRACVDEALNNAQPNPERQYFVGTDWGRANDYTVNMLVDDLGNVAALDRFNQIGWEVQRKRLRVMAEQWRVSSILAENNSVGEPNIEQLQAEGLPVKAFQTTNESKAKIIQALALAFERREIRIPDNATLIAELEGIEATRLPSGRWRYAAPEGQHDDCVIALALAWWEKQAGAWSFERLEY